MTKHVPALPEGQTRLLPEDSGGVWGYAALLEALLGALPSGVDVRRKSETSIHFVGDVETAVAIAEGILTHIVQIIEG